MTRIHPILPHHLAFLSSIRLDVSGLGEVERPPSSSLGWEKYKTSPREGGAFTSNCEHKGETHMNTTQCWRATRARTLFGRYRTAAFAGLAAAAIVCGPAAGQGNPEDIGRWDAPEEVGNNWLGVYGFRTRHSAHLRNGSILLWNVPEDHSWVWDPVAHSLTSIPTELLINCSGHAGLPDGTLLVAGGSGPVTAQTKIYSLEGCPLCPWLLVEDMAYVRFYPTLTTLPDGQVLVTGGRDAANQGGAPMLTPEIFTFNPEPPPPSAWTVLDVETTGTWTYPHMFVVPDLDPDIHKVFFSSSHRPPAWDLTGPTYMLDITAIGGPTWTAVGGNPPFHTHDGSTVMYEPGKILKSGGDDATLPESEGGGPLGVVDQTATINLNDTDPLWQSENPMMFRRAGHNLVLLPVGKILAVGGEDDAGNAVRVAELFDPATGLWVNQAEMDLGRGHHSTAVLLADARVLSAGGDGFDANLPDDPEYLPGTAEVFSPPYLFKVGGGDADRPKVGMAPTDVAYGTSFNVALAIGSPVSRDEIAKVTLVRLSSVTHGFDMDQRYLSLPVQTDPGRPNGLVVEAPENGTFAPPGYYMLFLISDDGAPSERANYVRLYEALSP